MVEGAPVVSDAIGLLLVPEQFEEEMFRVIALRGAISSGFLNEQLAGGFALGVPQFEDNGVNSAIIPILSIVERLRRGNFFTFSFRVERRNHIMHWCRWPKAKFRLESQSHWDW